MDSPSRRLLATHQPVGGIVSMLTHLGALPGEPKMTTAVSNIGDLRRLHGRVHLSASYEEALVAGGTDSDPDRASLIALAEGIERYSLYKAAPREYIVASAQELGSDAIDLESIPRCSYSELSSSKCPLVAPDRRASIRWVRGLSLHDGRAVLVPAVMVYAGIGYIHEKERISLPISTGCAAHVSYERALLNAIFEVIERDAISVLWLQRLPFPRIHVDVVPDALTAAWDCYNRSSSELQYIFFDATMDLGIPTVYGVQLAQADERVTTLVSCSTDSDPPRAVAKVIRDLAGVRMAFRRAKQIPEHVSDFHDLLDGATYMARASHLPAFNFLLDSPRSCRLSQMSSLLPDGDCRDLLKLVLDRLRIHQMAAYVVDLSTDEALRAGIRVVRAIVPGLQPLSFSYRARYLGHSRLYEVPRKIGYPVHSEAHLNSLPQPFA